MPAFLDGQTFSSRRSVFPSTIYRDPDYYYVILVGYYWLATSKPPLATRLPQTLSRLPLASSVVAVVFPPHTERTL